VGTHSRKRLEIPNPSAFTEWEDLEETVAEESWSLRLIRQTVRGKNAPKTHKTKEPGSKPIPPSYLIAPQHKKRIWTQHLKNAKAGRKSTMSGSS